MDLARERWQTAACELEDELLCAIQAEGVMRRREFLSAALGGAAASRVVARLTAAEGASAPKRFLLSANGCGRATGYAEANKIITRGDKTHVCWLDSVSEGFRARIRTLNRLTGQWSPTYTLGEAHDNHGGPALAIDGEGFLHAVYYPHHHPFRYRKSTRPNDASQWEDEIRFGERCTYPTLVCGPDDTLYFTCRRSFSSEPWRIELWTKRPRGDWTGPGVIALSRFAGYSHFQESLAWSPDRRRLHLCCRFHEKTDSEAYGRLQTVGYMASDDFGKTWRRSDGSLIEGSATAETIDVLESGGVDRGRILRAGAMAVDGAGTPHIVYSVTEGGRSTTIRATPRGDGRWRRLDLTKHLPKQWRDWDLTMAGGVTFNDQGHMMVTATLQNAAPEEDTWGHRTNEVVELTSTDGGGTFSFRLVSEPDGQTSHWLPNVEKSTGHNAAPGRPGVIFTAGPPGEKNTDILSNRVYWFG
jgi:hypothetical protein